jgi:DNA-binding MarR family transcriptional regulator
MGPAEQLYLLAQHAGRRFRTLDAELGLTPARFSLLAALRYHGPQRIGELAGGEGVAQPTMTKLVATAEDEGLVERRSDPDDRRGAVVVLTPAGRALLRRARSRKINWISSQLRTLPTHDVERAGAVAGHLDAALRDSVADRM